MGLAAFKRMRRLKDEVTAVADMKYQELRALAKKLGVEEYHKMNTEELRVALEASEASGGDSNEE